MRRRRDFGQFWATLGSSRLFLRKYAVLQGFFCPKIFVYKSLFPVNGFCPILVCMCPSHISSLNDQNPTVLVCSRLLTRLISRIQLSNSFLRAQTEDWETCALHSCSLENTLLVACEEATCRREATAVTHRHTHEPDRRERLRLMSTPACRHVRDPQ
jgi:hypothetical protein